MVRKALWVFVPLLLVVLYAPAALADKYDLKLTRLFRWDPPMNEKGKPTGGNPWILKGEKYFENLMWDMGTALAPRFLGPACTSGSLGFQVAMNYSLTAIPVNAAHWAEVMTATGLPGDPDTGLGSGAESPLQTIQFNVRKGLPFSAELGGNVTKLVDSGLWGVGLEVKYAALEGFKYAPEIGFRGTVNTFLGSKDYALLLASWDAIVSKKFGIAGLFKLAPYAGYNGLYIHGSSNVILTVPKEDANITAPQYADPQQQVFNSANIVRTYAVFGFQVIATVINTGFEAAVDMQDSDHQTYSFRFGVDF